MRLKKRRKDWEKRMQQEQDERAQLREQEAAVVNQVIDSQVGDLIMFTNQHGEVMLPWR